MISILALLGAALLSYPIFVAIGLGLSLCVFGGILCLMLVIFLWLHELRDNQVHFYEIATARHYEMVRIINKN